MSEKPESAKPRQCVFTAVSFNGWQCRGGDCCGRLVYGESPAGLVAADEGLPPNRGE